MARWDVDDACFDVRVTLGSTSSCNDIKKIPSFRALGHLEIPECHQRHIEQTRTQIDVNPDGPGRSLGPFRGPRSKWPNSSALRWTARGPRDTQLSVSGRFHYMRRGWLKKVVKREQKVGNLMMIVGKSTSLVVRLARLSQRINLGGLSM